MDVVTPDDPTPGRSVVDDEPSADELGDEPVAAAPTEANETTDAPGDTTADGPGAPALDLSPRAPASGSGAPAPAARTGGRRGWLWIAALVVLVVGIGFVISRAISDATQFYVTADEAVARKAELAGRTFRMEGSVVAGTPREIPGGVTFRVFNKGTEVVVNHAGDPPQLFQPCIPVVVEGRWDGTGPDAAFSSTAIIVAHDENYEEQNSERIQEARAAGAESPECAKQVAVANR